MAGAICGSQKQEMKKRDVLFTCPGVILIVVAALFAVLPRLEAHANSVACLNTMSAICCGATFWADDHGNQMPRGFISMSNELNTPRILVCPGDRLRRVVGNWSLFAATNSSYMITAPGLSEYETNTAYLQCTIHSNHLGYVYGYVSNGKRKGTLPLW